MKKDWLEAEDLKFALQISNFGDRLPNVATLLGITPAEVTAAQNDGQFVLFVITANLETDKYKQDWTKLKDQVRYGTGGNVLSPFPVAVDTTGAPTAVEVGVEARFRAIVKKIKASPNYTIAIGEGLGIEAADSTGGGSNKPTFKIFTDSGHPVLKWVKGAYQGVEIWAHYGTEWVKAERDFHSPFADKHALPAAGSSAVWKYKMIYLKGDETTGDWSDEVSVTVYGSV